MVKTFVGGCRMQEYVQATSTLYQYLLNTHWNGHGLVGPDAGIRFNWRIGRFVKSYFPSLAWKDSYYYLQAQGYWILANWRLFGRTGDAAHREIAVQCSRHVLERQRDDGAWDYPNPEWRGRVATAEGTWGSLGLLETYRQTGDSDFLTGALRWHQFLLNEIGFEQIGNELAVKYFSNNPTARIPNNSAFVLRFLAELADLTGADTFRTPCRGLLAFLSRAQKPTGEFPYMVPGSSAGVKCWEHFLCYQYNAFQCMDLMRYYELTEDPAASPLITACLDFLGTGVAEDGHCLYDCHDRRRLVSYYSAALGASFALARQLGLGKTDVEERPFQHLLDLQSSDGSFPFSRGDYHYLSDRRPYPRVLAMILFHLLVKIQSQHGASD
jgi:hypothetical protein